MGLSDVSLAIVVIGGLAVVYMVNGNGQDVLPLVTAIAGLAGGGMALGRKEKNQQDI